MLVGKRPPFYYDQGTRMTIMASIQRQNSREHALADHVADAEVRWAIRHWFRRRWEAMLREYERRVGE